MQCPNELYVLARVSPWQYCTLLHMSAENFRRQLKLLLLSISVFIFTNKQNNLTVSLKYKVLKYQSSPEWGSGRKPQKPLALDYVSQWKFAFFFLTHPDRYLHYILTDAWPMTKVLATATAAQCTPFCCGNMLWFAKFAIILSERRKHFLNWNWKHKCEFKPITQAFTISLTISILSNDKFC